jgi:hypothetical protein
MTWAGKSVSPEAHDISEPAAGGVGFNCKSTVAGCPGGQLDKYESRMHNVPRDLQDLDQTTFQFDYDITDKMAFKYIYGSTEMNTQAHTDYAGAEYNFFMNYDVNRLELESNEFQFTGGGDRISWLAGAYTRDQTNSNRGLSDCRRLKHAAPAGPRQILDFNTVSRRPPATRRRSGGAVTSSGRPSMAAQSPVRSSGRQTATTA